MIAQDTRFYNNATTDRRGAPLSVRLSSEAQYSRLFYGEQEGQLATFLLSELKPSDHVLDIGGETGVFTLTAARRGARVTTIEYDAELAESLDESIRLNGVADRVLLLTWLPNSVEGYATMFGKAERGCVYSGIATVNQTSEEYLRPIYTLPTHTIDNALREGLIEKPTIVLEGMHALLAGGIEDSPRYVLVVVYPYQVEAEMMEGEGNGTRDEKGGKGRVEERRDAWLRRVVQWMRVRGYSAAADPPLDLPNELEDAWMNDSVDLEHPLMLDWYKQKVYNFFSAQMNSGGVQGQAFLFQKVARSTYTGEFFRPVKKLKTCKSQIPSTSSSPSASPRSSQTQELGEQTSKISISWTGHTKKSRKPRFSVESSKGSQGLEDWTVCSEKALEMEEGEGDIEQQRLAGEGEEEVILSEAPLTLVSAVSKDYFDRLRNLIGSVHTSEPDLPVVIFDMGLSKEQRKELSSWDGVELRVYNFDKHPEHVRTLANYAWKMPLIQHAAEELTNILYLDSSIELRSSIEELREMLASDGYFFTTQGCNLADAPDVPCDPQEACTVGDKTPPGLIHELFGIPDEQCPLLFRSCIAGGLVGINLDTRGGRRAMREVIEPAVGCSMRLSCIYPKDAVAIVNSNFDMAPLGLLLHAAGLKFRPERRFNAALFSALHTSEPAARDAGVILYTRRRFKGLTYLPFKDYIRLKDKVTGKEEVVVDGPQVIAHSRGQTGLLYSTPKTISREEGGRTRDKHEPVYPMTVEPLATEKKQVQEGGMAGERRRARAGREFPQEVYVSIILAARNDGHEGNFMTRLQTSLDQLAAAARMHPTLSAELVLVEWAPSHHRPPLRRALAWPAGLPPVRIIRVPASIHAALPQAAKDGFPQFYAKNVGMRRARGKFVLVTNGDILLGQVLVGILADRQLDEEAFYRIDRHDLLQRFHPTMRKGDMTEAAQGALRRVMTMQRLAVGDLLSRVGLEWDALGELHRTTHGHLRITFPDDLLVRTQYWDAVTLLGDGPVVRYPPEGMEEEEEKEGYANQHLVIRTNQTGGRKRKFFMMPVLVDSFLTVAAAAAGYKQNIFMPPACVFHQYHPQGTMPQRVAETVGEKEISAFIANVTWMLEEMTPILVNDENWGYAQESFEEEEILPGEQ
ncbi:hypothetical protein GUITHDRAFT_113865 [Guillardia theta CCMP2712]|uniref:Uncharacterized protein n=1 Tax=Guillardia theta (strain CCMP2712) TaxID=905079 RepID=L1IW60_GUITC|nr:hypothetical protein GUITHDRAFT_113865 [Guillardia theta CCMP2712]EKX40129.1 hypothetical protein GUITHDRAFT_113865 [Guillardia theta CCMP2712]|eukprot:XP_005827109.1 hypothetical protein GUITHDRAFT_113865 [Guillardia theta CCMP2712]